MVLYDLLTSIIEDLILNEGRKKPKNKIIPNKK